MPFGLESKRAALHLMRVNRNRIAEVRLPDKYDAGTIAGFSNWKRR